MDGRSPQPGASCMLDAMDPKVSAIERAFEIAGSGHAATIEEIRTALRKQGYAPEQIEGPRLRSQLKAIIKSARQLSGTRRT